MREADALRIVAYLNAAFPNAALDEASVAVYATEVALLYDAGMAMDTAQSIVRTMTKFPSIADFRTVYRSINEQRERERKGRELLAARSFNSDGPPEWINVWWWSRRMGEVELHRDFPQYPNPDPNTVLSRKEYTELEQRWMENGCPSIANVSDIVKRIGEN